MRYFDADSGEMIVNRFERLSDNSWAYFGANGIAVTGSQLINGQHLYFDVDGRQIKGKSISDEKGLVHYYDAKSGELQPD
ncbi:Glucosyltransferase (fragment) [Oenococcus oeni]